MPPVTSVAPRRSSPSASARALSTSAARVVAELLGARLRQGDRLGRHDVRQRASEHERATPVDEIGEFVGAQHHAAPRPA